MDPKHAIMRPVNVHPVSSSGSRQGCGQAFVWLERTQSRRGAVVARTGGYTMVELMIVVIIIGVVAALTIPNITRRMKERRASEAAQRVALLYQTARARAMGRGAAVLVRYSQPSQQGAFEMMEAQRGVTTGAGCQTLPVSSCSDTDWNVPALQQFNSLTSLDFGRRSEYENVYVSMLVSNTNQGFVDVCFTPMGRTFVRTNAGLGFSTMNGVYRAQVQRKEGSTVLSEGRTRTVMVLPNGSARLQ